MKTTHSFPALFPALLLGLLIALLPLCPADPAEEPQCVPGMPMPDFTVETAGGGTFTLSEVLAGKKGVLINLWATWCGPCEAEFPYLEEAYEQYRDEVEVIALSVEPGDTREVLSGFASSHGLTFPVARDEGSRLESLFAPEGVPTSVAVDRFGNIVMVELGAQTSADPFNALFALLADDAYTETVTLEGFPGAKPPQAPSCEELLAAAGGTGVTLASPADGTIWPFVPDGDGSGSWIRSSNGGHDGTAAEVYAYADAQAGDALAFRMRVSSEAGFDLATAGRSGENPRVWSGETGWFDWAVALVEGPNEIRFTYAKDGMNPGGDDCVCLSGFRVLHGEEARRALEAVPVYPYAEATAIEPAGGTAREIVFSESREGILEEELGVPARFFIAQANTAEFKASVGPENNADTTSFVTGNTSVSAFDVLGQNIRVGLDDREPNGYAVYSLCCADLLNGYTHHLWIFPDERSANTFEHILNGYGVDTSWTYLDGSERGTYALCGEDAEEGGPVWTVVFVDREGAPVPGCVAGFCTDDACTLVTAGEDGAAVFTGAPFPYHLQVISVPGGGSADVSEDFRVPENGGKIVLTVSRD